MSTHIRSHHGLSPTLVQLPTLSVSPLPTLCKNWVDTWNGEWDQKLTRIDTGLHMPHPLATLLAVPPPPSETGQKVQEAVEQAVKESVEQGIDKRGKEATPWLLKRVGELTGGSALDLSEHLSLSLKPVYSMLHRQWGFLRDHADTWTDIKLIENNARVGTEVAREMANIQSGSGSKHASSSAYMPALAASPSKVQFSSPLLTGANTENQAAHYYPRDSSCARSGPSTGIWIGRY